MDKQKIIDKVVKLLALSKDNENSNEAQAAKNMAAELMAKHDISIIEAKEKSSIKVNRRILTRLYPIKYDSALIGIICEFNGVAYLKQRGYGKRRGWNIFVGTKTDLVCCHYMIDILFQQRLAAWKKYLIDFKATNFFSPTDVMKKEWMFGFAFGLQDKLDHLTIMKENKIFEYGLVPVDKADQALAEYKKHTEVRSGKSRPQRGSAEGFESGKNAHINKGVNADTKNKPLKIDNKP